MIRVLSDSPFLFKEWIKLRRLVWVPVFVLAGALLEAWLSMRGMRINHGATQLWNALVYKQDIPFRKLAYALPLSGVWYACVQYLPDCAGRRLRLMFHLPVSHRRALYIPALVGLACCGLLFLLTLTGLWAVLALGFFLPPELTGPMLLTVLPWGLAMAVAYLATAAAIADPGGIRRLAIALTGFAFVSMLTQTVGFGGMTDSLVLYALLCLLWVFPLEAAALRVKEGK